MRPLGLAALWTVYAAGALVWAACAMLEGAGAFLIAWWRRV